VLPRSYCCARNTLCIAAGEVTTGLHQSVMHCNATRFWLRLLCLLAAVDWLFIAEACTPCRQNRNGSSFLAQCPCSELVVRCITKFFYTRITQGLALHCIVLVATNLLHYHQLLSAVILSVFVTYSCQMFTPFIASLCHFGIKMEEIQS